MTSDQDSPDLAVRIRSMQIIALTMAAGAFVVAVLMAVIRLNQPAPVAPPIPAVSYVGAVFAALAFVMSLILPRQIAARGCNRIAQSSGSSPTDLDVLGLCAVYQTAMIVGLALLEGPVFLLAIAFLMEGQLWTLIAAGVLWSGLLGRFPSRTRVDSWIDSQQTLIREQSLGSR